MRRLRFGLLIGFALGYWFGTKAGKERHRQLEELLQKARENETLAAAAERARDLVESGVDKGKELVDQVRSDEEPEGVIGSTSGPVVDQTAIDITLGDNGSVNPGLATPESS